MIETVTEEILLEQLRTVFGRIEETVVLTVLEIEDHKTTLILNHYPTFWFKRYLSFSSATACGGNETT